MTEFLDPKKWVSESPVSEAKAEALSERWRGEFPEVVQVLGTYAAVEEAIVRDHYADCGLQAGYRDGECMLCDLQHAAWRRRPLPTRRLTSLGYGLIQI